jgi:hypothetical protein
VSIKRIIGTRAHAEATRAAQPRDLICVLAGSGV